MECNVTSLHVECNVSSYTWSVLLLVTRGGVISLVTLGV